MTYSKSRIEAWLVATIDDDGEKTEITLDAANINTTYAINSIPSATAMVPPGRRLDTLRQATTHLLAKHMKVQIPVKAWCRVTPHDSPEPDTFIEGEYMMFDGYITGFGYVRTERGFQPTIEMTHWLSDLTFSSTLSESSHPRNPADLAMNAAVALGVDAGIAPGVGAAPIGNANINHFVPSTLLFTQTQSQATITDISTDLWGRVILPWFKDLANSDRLNWRDLGVGPNDSSDRLGLAALNRFAGDRLALDFGESDALSLALAIRADICMATLDPANNTSHYAAMANQTFWDKLVGDLAPTYFFAVIPRPDDALVVPYTPGLRDIYIPPKKIAAGDTVSIRGRDYDMASMPVHLPRLLRAVALFGGQGSVAGADMRPQGMGVLGSVGGRCVYGDKGLVIYQRLPRWAFNPTNSAIFAQSTLLGGAASAVFPNAGAAPAAGVAAIANMNQTLLDRLACFYYTAELLKNRRGTISGPLRFDICPGSNVSFEGQPEKFVQDAIGDQTHIGSVVQVTTQLDAENAQARTAYSLSYIRTEEENAEDQTSIARHPLYSNTWAGDVLTLNEADKRVQQQQQAQAQQLLAQLSQVFAAASLP